ncbi:MAG TPA: HtaA domain-containing protein [Solirubrobacterales bacterium]|nr:HtaA domain-containing protein [Solirubrobacterales bacterium]
MSRTETRRSQAVIVALATLAALLTSTAVPARAAAAPAQGSVVVALANHAKGRTLSGQGVKIAATAPAALAGNQLTLPVSSLDLAAEPGAGLGGGFAFTAGSRTVAVSSPRLDVAGGALVGTIGGSELPIFRLGGPVGVAAGGLSLREGKLRLTANAAGLLRRQLALKRALVRRGVGTIWAAGNAERPAPAPAQTSGGDTAEPKPSHAAPVAVTGGSLDWGVLDSWRSYIYAFMGPGSVGSISTGEGATANGALSEAGGFVSFPAADGSYEKGLDGAGDRLTLQAQGSVVFAKPGHCIVEVRFSGLEVKLDGASSMLSLDSVYDIDAPPACADNPPVPSADVPFATLDLGAVAPTYGDGGRTITWANIPATLTAAGGTAWGAGYEAGEALDPLTISVETE